MGDLTQEQGGAHRQRTGAHRQRTGADGQGTGADEQGTGADEQGTGALEQGAGAQEQQTGTHEQRTGADGQGAGAQQQQTGADGQGTGAQQQQTGADGQGTGAQQQQTGAQRLAAAFARPERRAALMPYMMGGFPTLEQSIEIGLAYADAGADVIELGVPYSDPLADGPVIHQAATRALAAGVSLAGVLEVSRAISKQVPVVLMCYSNMVFAPGVEAFVQRLAQAGASGLIVPDLPLEESALVRAACEQHRIALVPLVAPTSSAQRMRQIGRLASGFLYTVSVLGTTGERKALSGQFAETVSRAKESTSVPVAIGFGIATPEQALAAAAAGADGVIVGTRLVRAAAEADRPAEAVGALVAELAMALSV
jgi:tryptophan synthase alpha chain